MSDEYVPITTDQVKAFSPDASLDDAKVGKFIEVATEHQLPEAAAKAIVSLSPGMIAAAPVYKPIEAEAFKAYYGDDTVKLDDAQTQAFLGIATEHKLNGDAIKALATFDQGRIKAAGEAGEAEWAETQANWKTELEKDSLLTGGDGYQKNLANVAKLIKDYGGTAGENGVNELQEMLNITGAGNHPAMARFMMRVSPLFPERENQLAGIPEPRKASQTLRYSSQA